MYIKLRKVFVHTLLNHPVDCIPCFDFFLTFVSFVHLNIQQCNNFMSAALPLAIHLFIGAVAVVANR